MKDNLNEERLERKLRKEWRKHFDHFEIVDETGINVISEIKIDPNIFYDAIDADILEFAIHRIFAVDKDGLMITYLDYLESEEIFITDMKKKIRRLLDER